MKQLIRIPALLLCAILLCTACAGQKESAGLLLPPDPDRQEVAYLLTAMGSYDRERATRGVEYLQGVLEAEDIRVRLDTYDYEKVDDASGYVHERLSAGGYICRVSDVEYDEMRAAGILMDLGAQAWEKAPGFMAMVTERMGQGYEDRDDRIPTPEYADEYEHLMVLLRPEVREAFGRDVESYEDYLAVLKLVRAEFPQYTPGLIATPYGDFPLLQLLLIDRGYQIVDPYSLVAMGEDGRAVAVETLPEFQEYMEDFAALRADGTLALSTDFRGTDISAYAAVLTSPANVSDGVFYAWDSGIKQLEAEEFVMSIPTSGKMGSLIGADSYLVACKGTDAREFLRLLEMTATSETFYYKWMLGQEGVDYADNGDGTYAVESFSKSFVHWNRMIDYCYNETFESKLHYERLPQNYHQARGAIRSVDNPAYYAMYTKQWQGDKPYVVDSAQQARGEMMYQLRETQKNFDPEIWNQLRRQDAWPGGAVVEAWLNGEEIPPWEPVPTAVEGMK